MSSTPPTGAVETRRAGTVALVGRSNVGKSTLMNALLGEALAIVSPIPQTTRNRVLGVVRHGDAQVGLLDTPGLHRPRSRLGKLMNAAARSAVDDADVVLFVTSPASRPGEQLSLHPGDRALLADLGKGKRTALVLNKIDLIKPRSLMLPLLDEASKVREFEAIVPISARRHDGLEVLLDEVAKLLPEGGPLWEDDELTDRPVRFFIGEFVRSEILRVARQELPYVVAVTVDSYDESGKTPRVFATIHVDREGQKPILLGPGGTRLRDIGIAARERSEALLGHRIHLELFVRVTPGWTDDRRLLDEMGYGDEQGAPPRGSRGEAVDAEALQLDADDAGDEGDDVGEGTGDGAEAIEATTAEHKLAQRAVTAGERERAQGAGVGASTARARKPSGGAGKPAGRRDEGAGATRGRPIAKVNHRAGKRGGDAKGGERQSTRGNESTAGAAETVRGAGDERRKTAHAGARARGERGAAKTARKGKARS